MKPKSIFLLSPRRFHQIYNETGIKQVQEMTENDGAVYSVETILEHPQRFQDVEIIFSGWGCPVMDEALLAALPQLKCLFYGAGSVRKIVSEAFWDRDILLTSSYLANALPVAEYTMASVILALKKAWTFNHNLKNGTDARENLDIPGAYSGATVGIISLGAIGREVCKRLAHLDVDVLAFDPFAKEEVFEQCNAQRVDDLTDLFRRSQVVSLHAPWLPQTEDMITGAMLRAMPEGGTFINTSRGRIVDEPAMLEVLQERQDLFAVIDVIADEKTYTTNPLGQLPNVFLTPHTAGSLGYECHRMGAYALEECRRYLAGSPPITPITRENVVNMA